MITDPTITVNAVAKLMPRILGPAPSGSVFEMADRTFGLTIKHNSFIKDKKSRVKSLVTFVQRAIVTDPISSVNDTEQLSISVQIDRPDFGFTAAQVDQMLAGFKTWLDTTTVTKLYGRES